MEIDLSIPVEVIHSPDRKEFLERFHKPQQPVVIRGLLDEQPAGEKWSVDWFKDTMGDELVEVFINDLEKHKWSHTTKPDIRIPFREYLDAVMADEPTNLRMFLFDLYKLRPELKDDFSCPPFYRNPLGHIGRMFLGGKGMLVKGHQDIDMSSVLLTQVFGRKEVILFAPEYTPLLYQLPLNVHSMADIYEPDYETFPGLRYVRGSRVMLEPGDSIYMPSGYWHFITYLDGGMGVSHRMLSSSPLMILKGVKKIMEIPVDKALNKLLGNWWNQRKLERCFRRADTTIRQYEQIGSPAGMNGIPFC